ncbi:MAG: dehydrogenase [Gemmataceae bacterium]|nr:dehydrogenase [Gemmataceae bacterium]
MSSIRARTPDTIPDILPPPNPPAYTMTTRLLALSFLFTTAAGSLGADPPGTQRPADRPLPPAEAAKAMTVPKGFNVTLFAGEPDVVQPIAMTFDTRGRLWVVECLSYPKWRQDGTGNDRVVILEDTDGDGRFDKKTVFLDTGVNLSGIEVGFGGVWLCSSPNLVFVPDRDGDDKPDGPPEVVLDGWNIKDTKHNVFNSLAWGPDGWLYGCNGIQAKARVGRPGTPDKDRVALDCGVWRYHPTRKVFDLYASGTTNPWGLDWDDRGQMFITNCVIHHLFHVVPGAHYQRMYGDDLNPHTYGLMTSCADHLHWGGGAWTNSRSTGVGGKPEHSVAGGGHAHSGCAVYLGDNFPAEYRDGVFMCNIHGNRLNHDRLERNPGGYVAKHAPDFLFANDSWFRGLAVKCGPDGGLYVADWTDTGECHNYDKADTTNGRIYRVVYGTPKPWKGDLAKLPDAELIKLQIHANDWVVRQARRVLQERAAAGKLEKTTVEELRRQMKGSDDVPWKLRGVWALHVVGGMTAEDLADLLGHDDDNVRAWAVMLAAEPARPAKEVVDLLVKRTAREESQFVLLFVAGAVQRLPAADAGRVARELTGRVIPEDDPNLALAGWYAVQSVLARDPDKWEPLLAASRHPLLARNVARYLVASTPAEKRGPQLAGLVEHLKEAGLGEKQLPVLAGIQDALAGLRETAEPAGWKDLYPDLAASDMPEVRTRAEALAVLFGNQKAIADLRARMVDAAAPPAARAAAIELLARRKIDGLPAVLHGLLGDPAVRGAAVRALAGFPDDKTPEKILAAYPTFGPAEKTDAVQTLVSRVAWTNALLDVVEKGGVPRADIPAAAARQVLALNDKALAGRLEKAWGKIQPASKERVALIAKWKGVLTPDSVKTADKSIGRVLFAKHCGACHKMFGEGGDVGPDLTGSQRANLDYLLENVLDPSAVVPREYQVTNFTLADGRLVSGIILRETPDGLTVRTANDTVLIAKTDIEVRKPTSQSIMPEGLLDSLKPDEARHLIAYLGHPEQVPLPGKSP